MTEELTALIAEGKQRLREGTWNADYVTRLLARAEAAEAELDGARHETRQWVDEHLKWRKRAQAAEQQLQALQAVTKDMQRALDESDASERGGGGYWIKGATYKRIQVWLASLTQPGAAGQE